MFSLVSEVLVKFVLRRLSRLVDVDANQVGVRSDIRLVNLLKGVSAELLSNFKFARGIGLSLPFQLIE